jgi:hypothetical protein
MITPISTPPPFSSIATPTLTPAFTSLLTPSPASDEEVPFNVWIVIGPVVGVLLAGGVGYYLVRRRR